MRYKKSHFGKYYDCILSKMAANTLENTTLYRCNKEQYDI